MEAYSPAGWATQPASACSSVRGSTPTPELTPLESAARELAHLGDGRAIADRMAARSSPLLLHPDLLDRVHRLLDRVHRLLAEAGDGPHPDPAILEGYLDVPADGLIGGWVWSLRHPELRFTVAYQRDGGQPEERVASGYRADLSAAGQGDGRHAFSFRGEPIARPVQRLEVRLGDSPWRLTAAGVARSETG